MYCHLTKTVTKKQYPTDRVCNEFLFSLFRSQMKNLWVNLTEKRIEVARVLTHKGIMVWKAMIPNKQYKEDTCRNRFLKRQKT